MSLKDILDEVKVRGEKMKDEVVDEIVKSKTLNQIVNNKNFVKAVGKIIETKDEVRKVIRDQVNNVFQALDIPSQDILKTLDRKMSQIETALEKVGAEKIPVTRIKKKTTGKKKAAKKKTLRQSSGQAKAKKKTATKKKKTTKKAAQKKTSPRKASTKKKSPSSRRRK